MKEIVLTILLIFYTTAGSFSQITLSENNLPEAGYTYLVSTDTNTAVNLGVPSSSAQLWDYSNLQEDYMKFPTYDSTINTPYANDFVESTHYTYGPAIMYSGFYGGAPVGTQGMNNGYMFWRRDSTGFWIVGFRSDQGVYANKNVLLSSQELMIGTPATYGTVFNNTGVWALDFNDITADVDTQYVKRVEKTLTSDAFGQLITPYGNYPDVLRIHEYLVTIDSVYATLLGSPVYELELVRDTLNNYIFMDNNTNYPLCIVHADKNNTVLSVEYYKGFTTLGLKENNKLQPSVFPNPSNGFLTIEVSEELINSGRPLLRIYNLMGRVIHEQLLSETTTSIIIKEQSGIYLYTIELNDNLSTGKIILK